MRQQRSTTGTSTILLLAFIAIGLLLLILLFTCNTQRSNTTTATTASTTTARVSLPTFSPSDIGLPEVTPSADIIRHSAYTLSYNQPHKQPQWVAYLQTAQHTQTATQVRADRFTPDPLANFATATDEDYERQGFDRGHMAPAEDMAWSKLTMQESFYFTNISPQLPAFNRGVWRRLENLLRYWSEAYDSVYIVTGPVLTAGLPFIGINKVSVPRLFYKVVMQYNRKGAKVIGFVLPNEASAATLQNFAVTVDSVERLTGINFFHKLPDDVEEKLESTVNVTEWLWKKVRD
jgi:endonuclease G